MRIVRMEPRRRIEIDWTVQPQDRTDNIELTRTIRFIPITASGTKQWRRAEDFTAEPIVIPADELAAVIGALADSLSGQVHDLKREARK